MFYYFDVQLLTKKIMEIPVKPGLNGLMAGYAPVKNRFESEQSLLFFPPQNNGKGDSTSRELLRKRDISMATIF